MINKPKATDGERVRHHAEMLEAARATNAGDRTWRDWKAAATAELVGLADKSPRMRVLGISLDGDLHIAYAVQMPVPRWPREGELILGDEAVFDLVYQEEWRWESPPSVMPLGLLKPPDIFHPNARPGIVPIHLPGQGMIPMPRVTLCLGHLPPGTPPYEIALLGYYAVTLQDRVLDEFDPSGVLNPAACQFYRDHPAHLPLTDAGLLDPWSPNTGDDS